VVAFIVAIRTTVWGPLFNEPSPSNSFVGFLLQGLITCGILGLLMAICDVCARAAAMQPISLQGCLIYLLVATLGGSPGGGVIAGLLAVLNKLPWISNARQSSPEARPGQVVDPITQC
jgi:hypothetical protein